ncbi:MAG TPA: Ig-like domain-containing protein, partial [Solirubrobacter sp.]
GGGVNAGEGGDGLGAAIFNLNGSVTLTHVTVAGNTATAGAGATSGSAGGSVATVGYDSAVARIATTTIRQSIVTDAGDTALYTASPTTLIDGAPNRSTVSQVVTGLAYVGPADPQLAPLGRYGGPTRTMAPNVGSPVIGAATVQGLTTTDQRGFDRDAAADLGAVETQATTVATSDRTLPYSAGARNVALSATISPARDATSPGSVQFNAGALGSVSATISGGSASTNLPVAAGAAPGTYTLSAGAAAAPGFAAGSGTATIKILNAPQVCKDVSGTTAFQTAITLNTDCTGAGPVTVAAGTAAHGTVAIVAGALRYTPAAGYVGNDEFTYTTTNEGGASNSAKASVKVLNAPQVCKDVSGTTPFQTAITLSTDCTGAGPVTVAAGTAAHGTVAIVAGALRYTPAAGFAGSDEFTYTTTNEGGASNTAKASVKVLNAPQVCKDVSGTTAFQTAITLDTDCTGATPATVATGSASHGTTSVVDDKLRYTPEAGFIGSDEFTYTTTTEGGASNTAKATVRVLAPPPVCKDVSVTTPYETAIDIDVDCDRAGGITVGTGPKHGTVLFREGKQRYTPDAGFSGTDEFTYTSTNEGGASDTATVKITVNPPAPTCADVTQTAGAGRPRTVTLSCASIGATTFAIVGGPAHGKLSALDATAGTVTYTSADDHAGADTFTYRATNAGGDSAPATVKLTVTARPAVTSTPSADVTLGGAITDTVKLDPRFEPEAGTRVEFRLYAGDACSGTPVFTSKAELAADGTATSEAFTPTVANTYRWQATYDGDTGNLSATSTCDAVTVKAPPTVQAAAKPDAPVSVCGDPVVLLDVSPVGKQARLTGIARLEYAGQQVTIQRAGKAAGTATIGADGSFSALVGGPAAEDSPPVTYTAWLADGKHSRAFRYDRFLRITKRSGVKITGKLALKHLPKSVTLTRVNVCNGNRSSTSAKVTKTGTFAFTMRGPDAGSPYVLYRVSARLAGSGKTYSTQVAVAG